ncbi:unnamed protein product [Penicillium salamii]|uniref:Major facilitator superfamily (MFS) profile domain-containing protein n=1 Tax=Penicillium salamii TaxID=1612424 RepID=A0A9W4JBK7_9EURO|nr:unnamed protein product [Penicillium salamii]CAG8203437.1 unnamed protein product [Penicillium salamii]CAG8204329.1 unnamed protein product [Penicillium salamii]CAG8212033.1 unnamed protein product [Penicillium salamii]CAG8219241.1 unnamed protein product [Penicillium salamii]
MPLFSVAAEYVGIGSRMQEKTERTPLRLHRKDAIRYVIFASLWLGSFLAAADSTIITTITTKLMSDFTDGSLLSWLGASYFIANAWVQPLCGQLTDIYSRRTGLIWSIVAFTVGNSLSATAVSSLMLIGSRFVAGIGGGAFIVITTMVANDLVTSRARGLYQGCTNLIYAMGHSSGGIFSAFITEKFSWHWSFFTLAALSILSGVLLGIVMPANVIDVTGSMPQNVDPEKAVDFKGALYFSVATFLLLFGLNDVAFSIPLPWVRSTIVLAGAGAGGFLFIRHSLRFSRPVLPLRHLGTRSVLAGCLINFCACCCFTIAEFFLPVIGQLLSTREDEVLQASLILLPLSAGAAVGSMGAGVILLYYHYPRDISIGGSALVFISSLIQATVIYPDLIEDVKLGKILMIGSTFSCGLGFGVLMTSSLVAVLFSLTDQRESARVTSLLFTFRSFGCALGLTLGSLACQVVLRRTLRASSSMVDEETLRRVLQSPLAIFHLHSSIKKVVLSAYLTSISIVLYTCAGLALLGSIIAFGLLPR